MTGQSEVASVAGTQASRYRVSKLFDDLPCCHRAWAHQGRCAFLHGYERSFVIEFACQELEPGTGFVVDFGALKAVRAALAEQFDHTTLIAADDPELAAFTELAARGVIDLRVMAHTGMEGAARWVYETVDVMMRQATGGRAWVTSVEARESRKNAVTLTVGPE
jgi:6-pyruvoyltetrahydropterin/6-carboxytetrahydropterin synthase